MAKGPRGGDAAATVLIVEDDAVVCAFLATVLERAAYPVVCATTAADALARLADTPSIDLLITDLTLSGTDGIELIRRARELRVCLPALVVSGYHVDERRLLSTGFLQKPFSAQALVEKVRELLTHPLPR